MSDLIYKTYAPFYVAKGLWALPVAPGTKAVKVKGWTKAKLDEAYFDQLIEKHPSHGLGLGMGSPIPGRPGFVLGCIDIDHDRYVQISAPQRIGCFLLRLCPQNRKKGVVFQLPYDKMLIARTLGMSNATFSRALNILRQKTAIHISGSRVEIGAVEKLKRFVYGVS